MSTCKQIDPYVAGLLPQHARAAFEAHLCTCVACRAAVTEARAIDQGLAIWLDQQQHPVASDVTARRLVREAQEHSGGRRPRRTTRWAIGLAAACVALAALVLLPRLWDRGADQTVSDKLALRIDTLLDEGGSITAPDEGGAQELAVAPEGRLVVRLGGDRLSLIKGASLRVQPPERGETRLRLRRGAVAVEAAPRAPNQKLSIGVDGYLVTVVGTRFLVEREDNRPLVVSVAEGQVMVVDPSAQVRLVRPGQRLSYAVDGSATITALEPRDTERIGAQLQLAPAAVHDPRHGGDGEASSDSSSVPVDPTPPERQETELDIVQSGKATHLPDEASIRQWLVAGDYAKAETALVARLESSPNDSALWWLLGECRRKLGAHAKAVAAYRKVVSLGGPAEANRARYQAAALLQDRLGDHQAAVSLLKEYVAAGASNRPLDAEARLRLGRGLMALGQDAAARQVLEELSRRYPGTAEALQAERFLQEGRWR